MKLKVDRCLPKEKKYVNTLADRSNVDVSCDFDTERGAKPNDFTKSRVKTFFLEISHILHRYWWYIHNIETQLICHIALCHANQRE